MRFLVRNDIPIRSGKLLYKRQDHAFDFEPAFNTDISLLIGDLNLGIDSETMLVQQVWGYLPQISWIKSELRIPAAEKGGLLLAQDIQPGVTKRLAHSVDWKKYYDEDQRLLYIGTPDVFGNNEVVIEFLQNCFAVLTIDNLLKAIWLMPEFEG